MHIFNLFDQNDTACKYNASKTSTKVSNFKNIKYGSEDDLKNAVGTVGPVSVAIDYNPFSFWFYKYGMFLVNSCECDPLDQKIPCDYNC